MSSTASCKHTGLVCDPLYQRHDTGPGHPESPRRVRQIAQTLEELEGSLVRIPPRQADRESLLAVHEQDYLDLLKHRCEEGYASAGFTDTSVSQDSYHVAVAAAGGVLAMVDSVFAGDVRRGFCAVRPPGHHALPRRGMGFCLLNNVSIAARYAQREHGAEKVLIVDWDVHHGNGTQEIFYSDGSVLFFSTHQFPWYPGTGREDETGIGDGQGSTINCPLEAGAAGQELGEVYREKLIPAAEEFDPDVVFISSGFDGRTADPLAGFELTDEDYADLTGMVMGIAHRHCDGRLISVLEGGYDPEGVGKAAGSHVQRLTQEDS